MKCLTFALAALAVGVGSGSALAQCNCGRGSAGGSYQPAYPNMAVIGRPAYSAWPTAPVYAAPARFGGCCAVSPAYSTFLPATGTAMPATSGMPGMAGMAMPGMAGTNAAASPEPPTPAADAKEVKLTGTLVCAKCKLKLAGVTKCTNALQVKEGDKTVTYLLDDKGMKEAYHEDVCGGGEKEGVTVAGELTEKDGTRWVKPTKVETKK